MTVFVPISGQPVVYKGITQLTGVQISIYDAQTLTPRQAFKDGLAISSWAQPIAGDTNGCVPNIWVTGNPYKMRIVAAHGAYTREIDNLPGDVAASGGGGGGGGGGAFSTGDLVPNYGTAIFIGRVRANGGTIGNTVSGATERANDDTDNLYVWLWNQDPNLVVSGGRGISGIADFQANKTITLPDLRFRPPLGIDDMGAGPSGRAAGALFSMGDAATLGSTGGEATHTLTVAELAVHTHTGTTAANATFQMTGTTVSAGAHNHGGTAAAGTHNHGGFTGSENANHTHDMSSMSAAGIHNHGGLTGIENATLTVSGPVSDVARTFGTAQGGGAGFFSYVNNVTFSAGTFNISPDHHEHSISNDGSHVHGGSTGSQNVNHQHAIGNDGNHVHAIPTDGAHVHAFTTNAGGVHTHTITTNASGSGVAHNVMNPFILATWYIIL